MLWMMMGMGGGGGIDKGPADDGKLCLGMWCSFRVYASIFALRLSGWIGY